VRIEDVGRGFGMTVARTPLSVAFVEGYPYCCVLVKSLNRNENGEKHDFVESRRNET